MNDKKPASILLVDDFAPKVAMGADLLAAVRRVRQERQA